MNFHKINIKKFENNWQWRSYAVDLIGPLFWRGVPLQLFAQAEYTAVPTFGANPDKSRFVPRNLESCWKSSQKGFVVSSRSGHEGSQDSLSTTVANIPLKGTVSRDFYPIIIVRWTNPFFDLKVRIFTKILCFTHKLFCPWILDPTEL